MLASDHYRVAAPQTSEQQHIEPDTFFRAYGPSLVVGFYIGFRPDGEALTLFTLRIWDARCRIDRNMLCGCCPLKQSTHRIEEIGLLGRVSCALFPSRLEPGLPDFPKRLIACRCDDLLEVIL